MLEAVKTDFGIEKSAVLQTAQRQFHDHHPARDMGIKSAWIERRGTMGNLQELIYDWKFVTLGDMADAVEKEAAEKSWWVRSIKVESGARRLCTCLNIHLS